MVCVLLEQWEKPTIIGVSLYDPDEMHEIAISAIDTEEDDSWLYACDESLTIEQMQVYSLVPARHAESAPSDWIDSWCAGCTPFA